MDIVNYSTYIYIIWTPFTLAKTKLGDWVQVESYTSTKNIS